MLRYRKTALATLLLAIAPFSVSARAQALEFVSADSLVVLRIKNVSDLSTKSGKFFTDLGVVQAKPAMADPLKAFQDKSGIKEGLNPAGDAAAVLLNGKSEAGKENAYMLIPVSDYAKFKSNFADAKDDGEITSFHFKTDANEHFMAHWGNYAAISMVKEVVATKPTSALKPTGNVAREMETKDAVLYANIIELRKIALPAIDKGKKQFLSMFEKQMKGAAGGQQMQSMIKAVITRYIDVAEGYLRDADSAVVSFNLTDSGVNIGMLSDFQPDSYSGKLVTQLKGTTDPLLTGLPSGKYIAYGGATFDPKVTTQIFNDFVGPMMTDMTAASTDPKATADMTKAMDAMKQAFAAQTGITLGIVAPRSQIGAESLYQGIEIIHGDSKTFTTAMREIMPAMAEAMSPAPPAPAAGAAAAPPAPSSFKIDSKENAKTIDGVSFDQYTLNFVINPKTPEEAQMAQAIAFIYGPNGLTYYDGAIDDKTTLFTFGLNEKALTDASASIKKNQNTLGELAPVKAVDAQLPKSRVAAGYFAADELVNTVVFYAKQFGMPVNMQLPPDLQPIASAVSTDGATLRTDIIIPTQLVQSITAAVMQTMMQMQGGQQGAPPNGGGL
jgi:hypothetical protein